LGVETERYPVPNLGMSQEMVVGAEVELENVHVWIPEK
jgi:hypothetical protein